jgi:hypothetical protein
MFAACFVQRKKGNRMFSSFRFTRLLLGLLLAALLGVSVSAIHTRPALASGACPPENVLNSDTKVQTVGIPTGSYVITVHTVLWGLYCGDLGGETTVTLSQCETTTLSGCTDTGTATTYVVGSNGTKYELTSASFTLSAPFLGSSPSMSVFTPSGSPSCGAAGGTYAGSGGEHILSGSAQRCL